MNTSSYPCPSDNYRTYDKSLEEFICRIDKRDHQTLTDCVFTGQEFSLKIQRRDGTINSRV